MKKVTLACALLFATLGTACATSFTGSAHVEEGRGGCERKCKGSGMEVAGMVYMGEYSDACICAVPGQTGSVKRRLLAGGGAVTAGAAGVVMQMTRAQQQNNNGGLLGVGIN
jgi:hypothetical protein